MSSEPASLEEQRVRAAEASGGTSCDAVYQSIEEVIGAGNLAGHVLDYGAGVGELTKRLEGLHRFESITGADIMARPPELPKTINWLAMDLNNPLPVAAGTYDVAIATEVIEHLENPRQVTRELYRVLKPGGTVILTTPNNESWRSLIALVVRGHYVLFDDSCYPAHITALLRKDFQRILTEAGFSSIQFRFTNLGGIPGHPTVSWQRISAGLLKGLRFSDNILVVAVK